MRINDDAHQWGWTGAAITGGPRIYGRVYVSTNGRGIVYGDTAAPDPGGPADPPPAEGACSAAYEVTGQWQGGFQAEVTLENTGTAPWTGWSAGWTFPGGQRVTQLWNAGHTRTGAAVTARNTAWNGSVRPGGAVTFGFTGTWSETNPPPSGLRCTAVP